MRTPSHIEPFSSYAATLPLALDAIGARAIFARQRCILIKPNLVNASPPPVTLPVAAVEALVRYIRDCSGARLVIGEGCGEKHLETDAIFRLLGYERLAETYGLELIDLNHAPLQRLENRNCPVFPELWLPEIVMSAFLVSFAVLKAHSLATVTLSMKNLIGCAPPSRYQQEGHWKKSAFHARMHDAILDLNRYRAPDLALVDASVGLAEYHLGGPTCDPPIGQLLAGFDPVAVDAAAARLLGFDWREIPHIRRAHGELGHAEPDAPHWSFENPV